MAQEISDLELDMCKWLVADEDAEVVHGAMAHRLLFFTHMETMGAAVATIVQDGVVGGQGGMSNL